MEKQRLYLGEPDVVDYPHPWRASQSLVFIVTAGLLVGLALWHVVFTSLRQGVVLNLSSLWPLITVILALLLANYCLALHRTYRWHQAFMVNNQHLGIDYRQARRAYIQYCKTAPSLIRRMTLEQFFAHLAETMDNHGRAKNLRGQYAITAYRRQLSLAT